MPNISYKHKSLESLQLFIDSYKNSFIKLIKDSGLEVEGELIHNYITIGNNLYKNILDKIEKELEEDIVLGRAVDEKNENCIIIKVNNFNIFTYYIDKKNERYITNIKFFKS